VDRRVHFCSPARSTTLCCHWPESRVTKGSDWISAWRCCSYQ